MTRHRKQFCPQGHDTFIVGRYPINYNCRACKRSPNPTGRPPKQFCIRGHDTFIEGRAARNGQCLACKRLGSRKDSGVVLDFAPLERLATAKGLVMSDYASVPMLARYRSEGIALETADRMAVRCGYHPAEVWGDDFYQGIDEEAS